MRGLAVGVLFALVGCVEADLDANGYYICTLDEHCAPGKVCAHNRCYDVPAPECSPFDSAGCRPDQRCATTDSGPACVTAGPQGLGQSCDGDLTCGHGLVPVDYSDGVSEFCACSELCRDDSDCSAGSLCASELVVRESHRRWGPVPIGLCI